MQLFCLDEGQTIDSTSPTCVIHNRDIAKQMKTVLRYRQWDIFAIQCTSSQTSQEEIKHTIRYTLELTSIQNDVITATITQQEHKPTTNKKKVWLLVAMPNKWSKIELIVQKCTELWVDMLYFWQAERSIIKHFGDNKLDRCNKIAREAVEQSRGRITPHIAYLTAKSFGSVVSQADICIFDKKTPQPQVAVSKTTSHTHLWIIWPEGWLSQGDYERITTHCTIQPAIKQLWDSVLRTETAAIIATWELLHHSSQF